MSFEASLQAELDLAKEHKSTIVQKAREVGFNALIARVDIPGEVKSLREAKDKFDQPIPEHLKAAGRQHALRKHLDAIADAERTLATVDEDIARNSPPLLRPDSAAGAVLHQELRAAFKAMPEAQRFSLKGVDDETLMSIATVPAHLSGMAPLQHASLRESLQRKLYPDAMAQTDIARRVVKAARDALSARKETAKSAHAVRIETSASRIVAA